MSAPSVLLPTTVPGLDTVLRGGLVQGSLVFVVGIPGAGKTMLASQIAFAAASRGTQALMLTTYSEGSIKLVGHLQPMAFFDEDLIGGKVSLLSLPTVIGDEPADAAKHIIQVIRQVGARIVVIDGIQGIVGLLGSPDVMRRTLGDLANLLAFLDVIVVVTLEGVARDPRVSAALTTSDTVIGLEYKVEQGRHVRHIDIIKHRGTAPLPGLHPYRIDANGITVFPRLESLPIGDLPAFVPERAPFGLPELDRLLNGGVTARSTTILAGAPGVGKTTLALHWGIAAATPQASTLFVSFSEHPDQLQHKATAFGLDLEPFLASGALKLLRLSPVDIVADIVADALLDALTSDTTRLIVDDVAGLLYALGDRGAVFLSALIMHLYQRRITTLCLLEIEAMAGLRINLVNTALSLVAENVIMLQHVVAVGRMHRMLAVLKMRFSEFDQTLREIVLDEQGIRVLKPSQTALGVLDEAAHEGGGFSPNDVILTDRLDPPTDC